MNELLEISLYGFFSGITVFIGGVLAKLYSDKISKETNHFLVAFTGGIIISAISFVLIPKGMESLSLVPIITLFILGGIVFFLIDRAIESKGGDLSFLFAMLLDYLPEAVVLGATFVADKTTGILLAFFIALQNLPESFNSYLNLRKSGISGRKSLLILALLSFAGVVGALLGDLLLSDKPQITAGVMIFASSGILYLIFQDIAPNSKMKNSWVPALGVNFGFLMGIIGERLI